MTDPSRQRRILRAATLSDKFSFAKEMLSFYIHVARFQEEMEHKLIQATGSDATINVELNPHQLKILRSELSQFLSLCRQQGPQGMSNIVEGLNERGSDFQTALVQAVWTGSAPDNDQGLLLKAFLQPYAELLRSKANRNSHSYVFALCPFCHRKPVAGALRSVGEGAARSLVCSFCMLEWEFRRIVCAACGEENAEKLPVYTAPEFPHARVECCDACKTYLKTIDLSKDGHADPIVDELASLPLDLWAREHGYAKLQNNILGM
jgi:formate dehydrogenase accessory protein FdhE